MRSARDDKAGILGSGDERLYFICTLHMHSCVYLSMQSMQEIGNVKAKEKYEAKVPSCWVPPKPHSKKYVNSELGMHTDGCMIVPYVYVYTSL